MTASASAAAPAPEGRRERKRRETRTRILDVAMTLFIARGFNEVTVDEIAEAADISKRSFFDYFPTKEDVVEGWQDHFATLLVAGIAGRPLDEAAPVAVENAMMEALIATSDAQSWAVDRLIRETPALTARQHMRYVAVEAKLIDALASRPDTPDRLAARILAMIAIGALRIGVETWHERGDLSEDQLAGYSRDMFRRLWDDVGKIAAATAVR